MPSAPFTTRVASRTDSKRAYSVRVTGPEAAVCDCFKFRRYHDCHHLAPAIVQYLHWRARQNPAGNLPGNWRPILSGADQKAWEAEHANGSAGHPHCWACRRREQTGI